LVFAFFLKPRLDKFDTLYDEHTKLLERITTLKIDDKFLDLQNLKDNHTKLQERISTLKIDDNLRDLQTLKTDVALLKQSEEQRDKKLRDATDSLSKSLKDLEGRIRQAVRDGDNDNLRLFLTLREDQAETAYTLSRVQGGSKEEEARDEWTRAKAELAKFLEEQKRSSGATTDSDG